MPPKRAFRIIFLALTFAAPVACGINVLATGDDVGPGSSSGGTTEGGTPIGDGNVADGSDEASEIQLPPAPDPFLDGGLDVNQDNCLAICPDSGAGCDAGWCVFDCSGPNGCANDRVVCPPGIPCQTICDGPNSCAKGVDCTAASACRMGCAGNASCANGSLDCSGSGCEVRCGGNGSCQGGVTCDASTCAISCLGGNSCDNRPVACSGDSCTIRCGNMVTDGGGPCGGGLVCDTTTLCDVGCQSDDSCRNEVVVARSAGTALVQCAGNTTCTRGSDVSGGEAGVVCTGNPSCGDKTYCDAGLCWASCDGTGSDITFCCDSTAANCKDDVGTNCQVKACN